MRVLNEQWRKSESIAIRRAERLSRNLEKIMFVIYDNENECYDIIDEEDLNHLSYEFDLDYDLVIAANGTFSAPRGTVTLVRNLQNSGTFTHNGGTFEAVSGDNTLINTTGTAAVTFHNLLCSGGTLVNIYTDR